MHCCAAVAQAPPRWVRADVPDGQLRVGCAYFKRFGKVRVDNETQRRTPEDSALWYWDLASTHHAGCAER